MGGVLVLAIVNMRNYDTAFRFMLLIFKIIIYKSEILQSLRTLDIF